MMFIPDIPDHLCQPFSAKMKADLNTSIDPLILQSMLGGEPDLSSIDPSELLCFACREAYYHLRGRAPDVPEDDPLAGLARPAAFVSTALRLALKHAGQPMLTAD